MGEKTKVLYIGGHGRSGSTLLERLLDQVDGLVAVGELRHIWQQSFVENQLCSCGQPFSDCTFWQAVCEEAFGSRQNVPFDDLLKAKDAVDRIRHIPKILSPWQSSEFKQLKATYGQALVALYTALKKVAKAHVIVDASKDPSTPFLLAQLPQLDLHLLHLTRDSRAVGFSWQRKVVRPEIVNETRYMATYTPQATAFGWLYRNLIIQSMKHLSVKYHHLRYEDLITQPVEALSAIMNFLSEPEQELNFIDDNKVTLQAGHTVAGNPFRFQQGRVELHLDVEWEKNMKRSHQFLITILTLPLLNHYKYRLSSR